MYTLDTNHKTTGPAVIAFKSKTCCPCRQLTPILEKLSNDVDVLHIDVEEHPEIAMAWHVRSVPTTMILNSKGTDRPIAQRPEDIVEVVNGVRDYYQFLELLPK